ncbi:YceD family protein [Magnetospirillum molischianum]|uniref:DUF177 domain-containing protein n=1 Tax=Magnetospirillum molischianum DSM 120 TaxID=1150626 RepID=H8FUV8_MAGML|nr:DUF177 domain-containing protein [Magnetospirillum molischianum]CCG42146.1 conserved hypothetical protein [Magnetospirillum molischianum DSM 120]
MIPPGDVPEFSRPIRIDQLPSKLSRHRLEADPVERVALADRFGLVALESLTAEIEINPPTRRGLVRLQGRLHAQVVQTCVVTLVPLAAAVEAPFAMIFGPPEDEDDEIDLIWGGEDPPDPIEDGKIDLGEVVAEQLALALDPFPRAPGAAFEAPPDTDEAPTLKASPFSALAALRQKKG